MIGTLAAGNWCNPPDSGLGLRPTASTGVPLLDAYLWVKTPGQSDGQCDAAGGVRAWDYTAYTQPGWPTDAAGQATVRPAVGHGRPGRGRLVPAAGPAASPGRQPVPAVAASPSRSEQGRPGPVHTGPGRSPLSAGHPHPRLSLRGQTRGQVPAGRAR